MNFFEHQDRARRNTAYLVVWFGVAIAGMIASLYLTLLLLQAQTEYGSVSLWEPGQLLVVSTGVLSIVGFGSLSKTLALRQGGQVVARDLGGRQVLQETTDFKERQLLNVVEEMAIASGVSVPTVYLLDGEKGINAFAAGLSPNQAVIGVTQGCLDQLTRDELQGVIGHEFSHILNGDMRLNVKLIGILNGILMVHLIGRTILRYGPRGGRNRKNGGGILAVAFAMLVIGGIGWVCGRLIKSAVSRQREFLADASAVQFTRNPDGLANALSRIAQHSRGSTVSSPAAEAANHLFFGGIEGRNSPIHALGNGFATHPPLKERIRRITGQTPPLQTPSLSQQQTPEEAILGLNATVSPLTSAAPGQRASEQPSDQTLMTPERVMSEIGTVVPAHLDYVHSLVSGLPETLQREAHSQVGALTIAYSLFLDESVERGSPKAKQQPLSQLEQAEAAEVMAHLQTILPAVEQLSKRARLPLLELCIPSLRTLPPSQVMRFFKQVQTLVSADHRLSLREYALQIVLQHRLRPHFTPATPQTPAISQPQAIWEDSLKVLAALAQAGQTDPNGIDYAFRTGVDQLPGAKRQPRPKTMPSCTLYDVGTSLNRLVLATPKLKQSVVDAFAHTVLVDNKVTDAEADLLRAIIIALDCPVPPFLALA
ncbi:MAG: M48 family metallopeptidase [Cyanobacteria bacterium P01_F01_bin.4]